MNESYWSKIDDLTAIVERIVEKLNSQKPNKTYRDPDPPEAKSNPNLNISREKWIIEIIITKDSFIIEYSQRIKVENIGNW